MNLLAMYYAENCAFVVSTHIIEVGEALMDTSNIQLRYMPAIMMGTVPHYTYKMPEGITEDRQGMIILQNERIFELLGRGKSDDAIQ